MGWSHQNSRGIQNSRRTADVADHTDGKNAESIAVENQIPIRAIRVIRGWRSDLVFAIVRPESDGFVLQIVRGADEPHRSALGPH
jgi:hypothetical protein